MTRKNTANVRKTLSLLFALLMLGSLLAGCAPDAQTPAPTSAATSAPATSAASSAGTAAPQPAETYTYRIAPAMSAPIEPNSDMELYWEERLGVQFDIIYYESAQYAELLNLAISSGDTPDVFRTGSMSSVVTYYNNGVLGGFTPEFLKQNNPTIYSFIESNFGEKGFSVPTMDDGLMYTLPGANFDAMIPAPVIWNTDWLAAVGFDGLPTTLDEFEDVFYKFRNNDPDGDGQKNTYALSASGLQSIYGAFGMMTDQWQEDENGQLVYDIAHPRAKEALALLAKWYKDEILDPEYITGENKGGYWANSNAFCEERIGYTDHGAYYHWYPQDFLESSGMTAIGNAELLASVNPTLQFEFGTPPVGPYGDAGTSKAQFMSFLPGFSKTLVSDEPRFIKMLDIIATCAGIYDPADFVNQMYGIEGKHWEYNDSNVPTFLPEFGTVEGMSKIGANTTFLWMDNVEGRSQALSARYEYFHKGLYTDAARARSYENKLYAPLASAPDYLEEAIKVLTEAKTAIITGEQPVDFYETAIENFYKAGGDILTKEANAWYATQK